ncbi:MAG: hypothetical protein AAGF11_40170 [Myxococcota bacterium]
MTLSVWRLAVVLFAAGCAVGTADGQFDETDSLIAPPDEPAGDQIALGEPCPSSNACQSGICSAPWNGEGAPLVCVDSCVATEDSTRWCADDQSCCDPAATCGARGLCRVGAVVDGTGSSGTGSSGSSGSGSSGSGSSGSGSASSGSAGSGSAGSGTGSTGEPGTSSGTGGSTGASSTGPS